MRHDEIASRMKETLRGYQPGSLYGNVLLLLSERAALRAVEDAARVARANVIHGPSCTASKMGPDYAADCTCGLGAIVAALSALDAAREEQP